MFVQAEVKGRVKSKQELREEEAAARDAALATALPTNSKGFKMMEKLGFKQGNALGAKANPNGRVEPLNLAVKEDRGGIGLDSERKRKIREEFESEAKRVKAEEGEYRERVAREREEKRLEGLIHGAMKITERMDTEESPSIDQKDTSATRQEGDAILQKGNTVSIPTKKINVLWRGLVRHRDEVERERRMRYDLHQSLSRNANYNDPDEDKQDRQAWGKEEEEVEEEDPELDAFNALEPEVRLEKLVMYLRDRYYYCFWCKYRYPDKEMDGCPGVTEEDHD